MFCCCCCWRNSWECLSSSIRYYFSLVSLRPTKNLPSVILDSLQCARSKYALGNLWQTTQGQLLELFGVKRQTFLSPDHFYGILETPHAKKFGYLIFITRHKLLLAGHEKMKISRHSITVFSSHFIVKNCTEEVWLNSRTFSFAACCCPRMDNYHF